MSLIPPFFTNLFKTNKGNPDLAKVALGKGEWIRQEFDKSKAYHSVDLEREETNWGMYGAFDYGQWDKEAVAELQAQGRHIPQYNMIRDKVESLAGNLIKDFFDISFLPVDGKYTPFTRILRELMMSDKELLDWEHSYNQSVVDGLIFRGVERMVISDRYSPLGNIGFERELPGTILVDPYWRSSNSWDLNNLYKMGYMSAYEMEDVYDIRSKDIRLEIQKLVNAGFEYDQSDQANALPYRNFEHHMGSQYRVIEYHSMKTSKKTVKYSVFGDVVPEGDEQYQRDWFALNGMDYDTMLVEKKEKTRIYYVTTVVPELNNIILEDRMSEIQIGRLPFFFFSAARINGRDSGIVDLLIDPQQTINKRESLIDGMISSSAAGGQLINEEVFGDDPRAIEDYIQNSTQPGYRGVVKGDITANSFIELPKAPFPAAAINEENRMVDFLDRLSKVSAAQSGRSEGSEESGILFARKQLQTEINQTLLTKNLAHYWNEKGEAYMLLAQQLYSGPYREFSVKDGKDTLELNIPTPEGLQNDISMMPRHKVVVDQSPQGATQRIVDRAISMDIMTKMGGTSPLVAAVAAFNTFKTLDHSMEERDQYMAIGEKLLESALIQTEATNKQAEMIIAQADAQMQQAGQPQQGLPVEGQQVEQSGEQLPPQ